MDLSKYNTQQLKECLQRFKDKTSGNKQELIVRLQKYNAEEVLKILEDVSKPKTTNNSVSLLDVSVDEGNGKDPIATLTGEVSILKQTIGLLVQQLQTMVTVQQSSTVSAIAAEPVLGASGAAPTPVSANTVVPVPTVLVEKTNEPMQHNQQTTAASCSLEVAGSGSHAISVEADVFVPQTMANNAAGSRHDRRQESMSPHDGLCSTVTGHVDVRDVWRIMPEFCPGTGLSSIMFVERVNQLSKAYGWSEDIILYAIHDKLKGPARHWISAMPIFHRWPDFVDAFLSDFPSDVNSADLNMKMMRTRMARNETYSEYFYKMLTLGRGGGLDDAAIVTYIVNGIYDETTKKILSAMHFQKCSDLLRALSNLKIEVRHSASVVSLPLNAPNQQYVSKDVKPRPLSVSGITCFRCRGQGHMAKHCKMSRRVENGRVNNINSASTNSNIMPIDPTPNDDGSETREMINNVESMKRNKNLLKAVKILCDPTVECNALIDSGSSKSLIRRSVANRCSTVRVACREKLSGFAGGEVRCIEKISVQVKLDNVEHVAEFLVVEDDAMAYEMLIGIDLLAKATVVIERGVCHVMAIGNEGLDIEQELEDGVRTKLEATLKEYEHCFGEKLQELGKSKRFTMNIQLTSSKPVVRNPYPIPIPKQHIVEEIVDELLELGIVQHSTSAYASPIVLVKKQNGEHRLCVDYRELNSITQKQPWSMPTVDGVLATLSGKRFFTTLDMMSGYYQLELDNDSKPYTAFVTHHGHFEFCRMPFGLRNAPSAFQRMMAGLIAPLGKLVTSYVDEVIIATETAEENIAVLVQFLRAVEEEGLTLRVSKCSFLKLKMSFLGHQVDKTGIKPGEKTTSAIKYFQVPRNQQEVRRFLGLAGFFRKFVQNFAVLAKPLSNLLKNDSQFEWNDDCEGSFRKLKELLTESPVLVVYDMTKEHQLHTDASSVGLAAILLQKENDSFKPVAYYSRTCTSAENKYHAYELEVLAVVEGCQRFRTYLLGKHFTVVTDCHSIASVKLHKSMIPRVARWFLKLLEYDYDVIHRPGETMRHVDAMSRAPMPETDSDTTVEGQILEIHVTDWVASLQREDPKLKTIMDALIHEKPSSQAKQLATDYCVRKHRLFRKAGEKLLLVVPKGIRWRVLSLCHDDTGHHAVDGTMSRIKENFWFPRMRNVVKAYLKSCMECAYHRVPQQKSCELYGMSIPKLPFQTLHMDHLGPFIKSKRGNEYVLTIVDALTRYVVIVPVKSTKTKPVIDTLYQLTGYFGLPQKLISDRGTAFTSGQFADFCNDHNITHIKVAVRTPRANGLAERVNQAVLNYLKPTTTKADNRDWDCELRMLQWTLNTKINATTKMAPIDLVFDFPLRDLSGNKLLTAVQDDAYHGMNERREQAIQNIDKARIQWKKRFDAKYRQPVKYREGDLVLIEVPPVSTGESRKLQPAYRGPYEIRKVLRFDRYLVEDVDGIQRTGRRFSTVAAVDKIKPWCSLMPELDDDYDDESLDE